MPSHEQRPWWRREVLVPNWAMVAFCVLTVNGFIELVRGIL